MQAGPEKRIPMLKWFKRNSQTTRIGHDIYERIVAQARAPTFFRDMGVPDSMEGRIEMIMLHLVLILERLTTEGAAGQRLGQRLMEHLMTDLDDALRQIGIGDMGVPRRVKKAAAAFTERSRDYRAGLAALPVRGEVTGGVTDGFFGGRPVGDTLEAALLQHVYGARGANVAAGSAPAASTTPQPEQLAAYVRKAVRHLAATSTTDIFEGNDLFPPVVPPALPAAVPAVGGTAGAAD